MSHICDIPFDFATYVCYMCFFCSVGFNGIFPEGAAALAKMLEINSTLTKLTQ